LVEAAFTDRSGPPARLLLRRPDAGAALRIAAAINAALGEGTAKVEDPGSIALTSPAAATDNPYGFAAALDTLPVTLAPVARIVIDGRLGSVVAGGEVRVGAATVSHRGITLEIGGAPPEGTPPTGLVRLEPQAAVQDIAAGLHAVGARPEEIAAIFEALRAAGALGAELVIR
jgi:flagellar P-ring protein precursor FlgI